MVRETVVVDARFCGPNDSGNGGYVCGLLGERITGAAEVTLRMPPPLDKELVIASSDDGSLRLLDDNELVAQARPADLDIDIPDAPDYEVASRAALGFRAFEDHVFRRCFVCGPDREPGDGLRIFAGPVADTGVFAAPWIPDESLADAEGAVDPAYLWAALDCPGYFGLGFADNPACLLGRMTAEVDRGIRPGDRCVVIGWRIDQDGRKYHAGTALFGPDGRVHGSARSTWIRLKSAPP